jgi:hypothetical protein
LKQLTVFLLLVVLGLATAGAIHASEHEVHVRLLPVGGSGVTGMAELEQMRRGGTRIEVEARHLQPNHQYLSLYYGDHDCAIEPYNSTDVIGGGPYTANAHGEGRTRGLADDDLDEINSISVRNADTFVLLACGDVHP